MKNNLKIYRNKNRVTQQKLADSISVSRMTIHAVETDKFDCSIVHAMKIARYFKVSVEDIFILNDDEITENGEIPHRDPSN
jgi:putative transcriptional regulator